MQQTFDVRRYGAAGNGRADDTAGIQAAIDAAGRAGGGVVWVPATSGFYRLTRGLIGRDGVTVRGEGRGSFLRNTRTPDIRDGRHSALATSSVFRIGGYEGNSPFWAFDDPTFPAADARRGETSIRVSSSAFRAGDVVFVRTAAYDRTNTQKQVALAAEINEVTAVSGGRLTLRHPLGEDYPQARVIRSSTRTLTREDPGTGRPAALPVRVLRRFTVEDLRLAGPVHPASTAIFSYGGALECTFRRLWISECADAFMLNAMGRCTFDDIEVRYARRLGELAYFSHDNRFRNIRAAYAPNAAVRAANGWACNEGARDSTFEEIRLDHGAASTPAFIFGSGRRNRLLRSTIEAPSTGHGNSAVVIAAPGSDYKPKDCVVEGCTIIVGSGRGPSARFAIEVDSGGPQGGGNIVRRNTIVGRAQVAPIGLCRADVLNGRGARHGCENNVAEGNVHRVSAREAAGGMVASLVAEVNHVAGTRAVIDPAFRPNLIRDNDVLHRQPRVDQRGTQALVGEMGVIAAREYVVARNSVGTNHRWTVEAAGRMPPGSMGARGVRLVVGDAALGRVDFDGFEAGAWELRAEIGGAEEEAGLLPAETVVRRKRVRVTAVRDGSPPVEEHAEVAWDSDALDMPVRLEILLPEPGPEVLVERWIVTPHGDEWSFVELPAEV